MKIKYAFLDGTVTEVEVSDEIGAVIIDSRKAEHAQDERHRYHCYSYDAIDLLAFDCHPAAPASTVRKRQDPAGNRCHRRGQLSVCFRVHRGRQKKVFENFPPDTLTNPRFFWVHRKATKYKPSGKDGNPV